MPADHREAERALLRRDPRLGALATILDDARLGDLVRSAWSASDAPPSRVEVSYLRYKPGTAVVAGLRLTFPDGVRLAAARGVTSAADPKLAKIATAADAAGTWALVDEAAGIAVYDAMADRYLPALRKRSGPLGHPGTLAALRYKPERRWVGRYREAGADPAGEVADADPASDVLVKAHRPAAAARAVNAHTLVAAAGLPVPRLLAKRVRHGLVVSEWLTGAPLDHGVRSPDQLAAVGALLARLHAAPAPAHPVGQDPADHTARLRTAVRDVAILRPDLDPVVRATATAVAAAHRELPPRQVLVHGDFSADQVLLTPDGELVLLDLDRVAVGHPSADLASWIAADVAAGIAAESSAGSPTGSPDEALSAAWSAAEPLLARYEADAAVSAGGSGVLQTAVAGALLQLAAEPFRLRRLGWPAQVEAIVTAAAALSAHRRVHA